MSKFELTPDEMDTLLTFLVYCEHHHPYYKKEAKTLYWKIKDQQQSLFPPSAVSMVGDG